MKIGNPADKATGVAPAATNRTQPGEAKAQETTAAASTEDSTKVELSNTAAALLSGGATADFDADKVARITQAIAEGKFEINAEKIADRLIANAQEVLGKAQH